MVNALKTMKRADRAKGGVDTEVRGGLPGEVTLER